MGEDAGLAAARPGEDEQRPVAVLDGGALFGVEGGEEVFQNTALLHEGEC